MAQYEEKTLPSVVPASFSPKPEDFAPAVTQELRSQQSRWAQAFADGKISYLENQLRKAHYKRDVYRLDDGYSGAQAEALLREDIKAAQTAKTIMMDHISEWAGAHEEQQFNGTVLPQVWEGFVREVKGEPAPKEPAEEPEVIEDTLAQEEDLEPAPEAPVLPSARYDDLAGQPKSEVKAPDEITLGEVMAKFEEKSDE